MTMITRTAPRPMYISGSLHPVLYGVPEPRPAIVADDPGATEPESSSPSRISAVASAPDGAAVAKWALTASLLSDGPSP
jgi:hypothetical protein